MAQATSNLLMLIPVLCCCIWSVSVRMVGMWQWLRADEGGHPWFPPGAQAAALSLPKAGRFNREDVLEQPNEINHWILALALQTWPRLSTSVPVWKGHWCKCCGQGGGGLTRFRALHNLPSSNSEELGIKRLWLFHSLLALCDIC